MSKLINVGDTIYGFCNGAFGRDDYDTKICVMSKTKYAVFQYIDGDMKGKATVLNDPEERWEEEDIENWKKEYKHE